MKLVIALVRERRGRMRETYLFLKGNAEEEKEISLLLRSHCQARSAVLSVSNRPGSKDQHISRLMSCETRKQSDLEPALGICNMRSARPVTFFFFFFSAPERGREGKANAARSPDPAGRHGHFRHSDSEGKIHTAITIEAVPMKKQNDR